MLRTLLMVGLAVAPVTVLSAQSTDPTSDERGDRLRRALERNPRPGTAFDLWVRHLLEHGPLERAVEAQRTLANASETIADDLVLALLLQRTGEMAEAGAVLERVASASDASLPSQLYGDWLARERRLKDAVEAYRTALARNPGAADRLELQLRVGRLSLRIGREADAMAAWDALLAEHPDDRMLREELADVLADEGRLDDARARWAEARDLEPNNQSVQYACTMEIARLHERDGDANAVRDTLLPLLDRLDGESWQAREVRERVIQTYLSARDVDGLVACFTDRLTKRPDDLAARVALVDALRRVGRYEAARGALRDAIHTAPQRVDLREKLVVLLVRSARWDEAEEACLAWMQALPNDPNPHQVHGEILLRRAGWQVKAEDLEKTLAAWEPIASLDPDDASLALRVAQLCHDLATRRTKRAGGERLDGRGLTRPLLDAAEHYYRVALERDDQRAETHDGLGQFLAACGRREEALQQWRAMAAPPMDTPQRLEQLAGALLRAGELDEALTTLERAIVSSDEPARLIEKSIRIRTDRDDFVFDDAMGTSLATLEEQAIDDPSLERILQLRVDVLAQANQLDAETQALTGRVAERPTVRDAWLLGLAQAANGKPAEAIAPLRTAARLGPERARVAYALADVLEQAGKPEEAAAQFQSLIDVSPALAPRCLERLALLELAREDFDAAARAADALLVRAPGSLDAARLAADVARRAGRDERALEILRGVVRSAPRDVALRATLAQLLAELNQPLEAAEHCWQAFLDESDEDGRRALAQNIGLFAARVDRVETFTQRLRDRIERTPDHSHLDLCLADLLVAAERSDEALDHLERLHSSDPGSVAVLEHLLVRADAAEAAVRAAEYARRLSELDPSVDRLEALAKLQTKAKLRDEARATWGEVLAADPARADVLLPEIESIVMSNHPEDALDLAYAASTASPESVPLRRWAALLAMDQGDLDAMEEHFGALLVAKETGGIVNRRRGSVRFNGMDDSELPALALRPPLGTTFQASWFEDGVVKLLRTLPLDRLHFMLGSISGEVQIQVERGNGQLSVEYQAGSSSGTSSGSDTDESGPSFSITVDALDIYRAANQEPDLQQLEALGYLGGGLTSRAVQSRLRALGYSTSQPTQNAPAPSKGVRQLPVPPPLPAARGSSSRPSSTPSITRPWGGPHPTLSAVPKQVLTPQSLSRSMSSALRAQNAGLPRATQPSMSSSTTFATGGGSTSQSTQSQTIRSNAAQVDSTRPRLDTQPIPWPDGPLFQPFNQALKVANSFAVPLRDRENWNKYRGPFSRYLLDPGKLVEDKSRSIPLLMLLHVARERDQLDEWLAEMASQADPAHIDVLVSLLAVHGLYDEARSMLTHAPRGDTLGSPLELLAMSAASSSGSLDHETVQRTIAAVRTLSREEHGPHFKLSLVSHLIVASRIDDALAFFHEDILPTAPPMELLEYVPWIGRTQRDSAQEALFEQLLAATLEMRDAEELDCVLLALVRSAPEFYWYEAADFLVERLRRSAQEQTRSYSPELTVRVDHRASDTVKLTLPRPVASLDARAITLLTLLHERAHAAGLSGELQDVLAEAVDQATPTERLTLECAQLSLQWLDGERAVACAAWKALREQHPDDPSVALCDAHVQFAQGHLLETSRALRMALRALGELSGDMAWEGELMEQHTALTNRLRTQQLLGSPDQVATSLVERLREEPEALDLASYLPTPEDMLEAEAALNFQSSGSPIPATWSAHPTTALDGAGVVLQMEQTGLLQEFSALIDARLNATPNDAEAQLFDFLLADLRGENDKVTEHAFRLAEEGARHTPVHPSYEAGLRRIASQEASRAPALAGLVRILLGHLDREDSVRCNLILATLFDDYRRATPALRTQWLRIVEEAFALPNPRVDLAYACAHFTAAVHESILPETIVPLLQLARPHWVGDEGRDLLLQFHAPFLRERLAWFDDESRREIAAVIQRHLFPNGYGSVPAAQSRSLADEQLHELPAVGYLVEIAKAAGTLSELREWLAGHPAADVPALLACRMLAAHADADEDARARLKSELGGAGWSFVAFGDSHPTFKQESLQRLADTLERSLMQPETDRVEAAMSLCEVLGAIGATDRVRVFAGLAHRKDAARALETGLLALMPERGVPDRALVEGLDALAPDSSKPDQSVFLGLRAIRLGELESVGLLVRDAQQSSGLSEARGYLLSAWSKAIERGHGSSDGILDYCANVYERHPPETFDERLIELVEEATGQSIKE